MSDICVVAGAPPRLVADQGNDRVRVDNSPTTTTSTLGGTGVAGATDGSPVSTASFKEPRSVVCDLAGARYVVADAGNNKIRAIPFPSGNTATIAGTTNAGWADGQGTNAKFNYPVAVALDSSGSMYAEPKWIGRRGEERKGGVGRLVDLSSIVRTKYAHDELRFFF